MSSGKHVVCRSFSEWKVRLNAEYRSAAIQCGLHSMLTGSIQLVYTLYRANELSIALFASDPVVPPPHLLKHTKDPTVSAVPSR